MMKKEAFGAWLSQSSWQVQGGQKDSGFGGSGCKKSDMRRIQGGHVEGLSTGLEEVLANCLLLQKRKVDFIPGHVWFGRGLVDSDWGFYYAVKEHFEDLFNPSTMSTVEDIDTVDFLLTKSTWNEQPHDWKQYKQTRHIDLIESMQSCRLFFTLYFTIR